jgi:protein involved in polysaccharide export with SLBB domain
VSIDKAIVLSLQHYGDVGQPGIRLMSHRMTVSEAIAEAGGVLNTGRQEQDSTFTTGRKANVMASIPVNVTAIYKGKAADNVLSRAGRIRSSFPETR